MLVDGQQKPSPWNHKDTVSRWADVADFHAETVAAITALRVEREPSWVHRRLDRFVYIDERRVRKSIEVDITVPTSVAGSGEDALTVLPIAQPTKRFMRDGRLEDEEGRVLSPWSRDSNSLVSTYILMQQAEQVLGDEASKEEREQLQALEWDFADIAGLRHYPEDFPSEDEREDRRREAIRRFEDAEKAVIARQGAEGQPAEAAEDSDDRPGEDEGGIEASEGGDGEGPERAPLSLETEVRAALWADGIMRAWMFRLGERFLMLVEGLGKEGDRRKLTLSYERDLELDRDLRRAEDAKRKWPGRTLGAVSRAVSAVRSALNGRGISDTVTFATRGPLSAASYHAEVLAPTGMRLIKTELWLTTSSRDESDPDALRGRKDVLADDEHPVRGHVYANGRRPRRPAEANDDAAELEATCLIRSQMCVTSTLLYPVVAVAAGLFAVLAGAITARYLGTSARSTGLAAVLLGLPALYAAFLVPRGHALLRRMFTEFRVMLYLLAVIPYVAAITLAVDVSTEVRLAVWQLLLVAVGGCLWGAYQALRVSRGKAPLSWRKGRPSAPDEPRRLRGSATESAADRSELTVAGDIAADAIGSANIGAFVGREDPVEHTYNYREADARAERVLIDVDDGGALFDKSFQPAKPRAGTSVGVPAPASEQAFMRRPGFRPFKAVTRTFEWVSAGWASGRRGPGIRPTAGELPARTSTDRGAPDSEST